MSATEILEQISKLPESEQREVMERLEAQFGYSSDAPSADQIKEMERRGEALARNPENGIPWEQVRAELQGRIKARSCRAK